MEQDIKYTNSSSWMQRWRALSKTFKLNTSTLFLFAREAGFLTKAEVIPEDGWCTNHMWPLCLQEKIQALKTELQAVSSSKLMLEKELQEVISLTSQELEEYREKVLELEDEVIAWICLNGYMTVKSAWETGKKFSSKILFQQWRKSESWIGNIISVVLANFVALCWFFVVPWIIVLQGKKMREESGSGIRYQLCLVMRQWGCMNH